MKNFMFVVLIYSGCEMLFMSEQEQQIVEELSRQFKIMTMDEYQDEEMKHLWDSIKDEYIVPGGRKPK